MSTVFVCVGQCGNQVGAQFISHMLESSDSFVVSDPNGNVRALFVDTERKVVNGIQKRYPTLRNRVQDNCCVTGRQGRGQNWAYGYSDNEMPLSDIVEGPLRRLAEQLEYFSGVLLFHSLSGGTGSGMGSRLLEVMKDIFAIQYASTCSVLPDSDSPLQNYNCVLSLAHIQPQSDCVLLYDNRTLNQYKQVIGVSQANQVIASQLGRLMTPCRSLYKNRSARCAGNELPELIRSCCSTPSCNLLQTVSGKLVSDIVKRRPCPRSTISSVLVCRGPVAGTGLPKRQETDALKTYIDPVSYNPYPIDYWFDKPSKSDSFILAHNSVSSIDRLSIIADKSALQLSAGAYLHQYQRYLSDDDSSRDLLNDAIECVRGLVDTYQFMS